MSDDELEKLDEKFEILPLVASPLFNNMMYQTSLNTSTCSSDAPIIFTEPKLTLLIPEGKKKVKPQYRIWILCSHKSHAVSTSIIVRSRSNDPDSKLTRI
jgi:hypothetical protein